MIFLAKKNTTHKSHTKKRTKATQKPHENNSKKHKAIQTKAKDIKENNRTLITIASIFAIFVIAFAFVWVFTHTSSNKSDDENVVAKVNNDKIYMNELEKRLKYFQAQFGDQVTEEYVLNQTINELLLLQEAKKLGITADENKVDKLVEDWRSRIEARYPEEQLNKILEAQNTTMEQLTEDMKDSYRKNLMILDLLNRTVFSKINISNDFNVSDKELIDYYNSHKDDLKQIKAEHILICFSGAKGCMNNRTKEDALSLITELRNNITAGKITFESAAKEFSDDKGSAKNNGSLGWFGKK